MSLGADLVGRPAGLVRLAPARPPGQGGSRSDKTDGDADVRLAGLDESPTGAGWGLRGMEFDGCAHASVGIALVPVTPVVATCRQAEARKSKC